MHTTPLTDWHRAHGAKMAEFGGFLMPMEYQGIIAEHQAVRTKAGIFDVSHMGEFDVKGPDAALFLDYLVTHRPSGLALGQALYSPMCYETGGTVDDVLVYRKDQDHFMMVVNAANWENDWQWVNQKAEGYDVQLADQSESTALLAVQGPEAVEKLQELTAADLGAVRFYHAVPGTVMGFPAWISRTGYTGEDGFELYIAPEAALPIWEELVNHKGVTPAGLGARDTLRLEAGLPLYGHELSRTISPVEAGLERFIKWDKPFVGREALIDMKDRGLTRQLVGLTVTGGIARAGYPVYADEADWMGQITSGSYAPTLKQAIAMALVPPAWTTPGTPVKVGIRDRKADATVVPLPFYRRPRNKS
ncbi:MAG: glycine cleavage system aminomethyltransferase GcvT [Sulfobacillus sp.]|nr:glycine cleavage system aminomethyltransferase GcvT [Sulfobacillus sp.]